MGDITCTLEPNPNPRTQPETSSKHLKENKESINKKESFEVIEVALNRFQETQDQETQNTKVIRFLESLKLPDGACHGITRTAMRAYENGNLSNFLNTFYMAISN